MISFGLVDPDLELLERWRDGDKRAGNELFRCHYGRVYRFFMNKTEGDIEMLVQDTFLACTEARDRFQNRSSFRTFLLAIAKRPGRAVTPEIRESRTEEREGQLFARRYRDRVPTTAKPAAKVASAGTASHRPIATATTTPAAK